MAANIDIPIHPPGEGIMRLDSNFNELDIEKTSKWHDDGKMDEKPHTLEIPFSVAGNNGGASYLTTLPSNFALCPEYGAVLKPAMMASVNLNIDLNNNGLQPPNFMEAMTAPQTLPEGVQNFLVPYGGSVQILEAHKSVSSAHPNQNELRYIEQLKRFPQLPLDAHRKIYQMRNEIIHYFEARLIHIENPSNVKTFDAQVVFLKSPATAQHWVMAFVKENNRVLVKFNRLLTVHVKISLQNQLTLDIEPSKSPNRRNDEQFIFNFENQRTCSEFLRVLNICKKEVWTHRGFKAEINDEIAQNKIRTREVPCRNGFRKLTATMGADADSKIPESCTVHAGCPRLLRFPYRMKFILKHVAVLYVRKDKKSSEYGTVGIGTLKIWGNDDCFDQLNFVARHTNEIICSHPIYSWNLLATDTADCSCRDNSFNWTAAADMLAAPTSLPTVREFRVVLPTSELAATLKLAFEESCQKACRAEIIVRSNRMPSDSAR